MFVLIFTHECFNNYNNKTVMNRILKITFNILRISLGLYFIFSGFVKGVDPLGSAYKFNDYFTAFGASQMPQLALVMSFLLSAAEFLIGFALVCGVFMNLTAWSALIFMLFFTSITLVLAITNLVSDCGCFGDAVKLTNWQTFYKNLLTLPLVLIIFFRRKNFKFKSSLPLEWALTLIAVVTFFGISIYSYRHLPIIDFIPYSIGTNIPEKMAIPAGAPQDEYETKLLYKNTGTGEIKEFTMNDYPWQDTVNWKWADTKSVLVKKGYTPPIHDFSISSPDGNNITNTLLSDTSYSFIFIAYNINKANKNAIKEAEKLASYCLSAGKCKFYAVTASSVTDINKAKAQIGFSYDFNSADETALKTIVRANPGLLLIKNGTIVGKWHYNDMRKIDFNNSNFLSENIIKLRKSEEKYHSYTIILGLGLVCSLLWAFSLYFKKQ
jgi:uncharacterized membrane protein YphA (DoxX/SURF4 family)